jgi:hypothetical protein
MIFLALNMHLTFLRKHFLLRSEKVLLDGKSVEQIRFKKGLKMRIGYVHIQHFKCFRDVKVIFSPGINLIVGKNNSGKSALIDAIFNIKDAKR